MVRISCSIVRGRRRQQGYAVGDTEGTFRSALAEPQRLKRISAPGPSYADSRTPGVRVLVLLSYSFPNFLEGRGWNKVPYR